MSALGKKESCRETLTDLLSEFLQTGNDKKVREYLASNSNLPGPRGNLELAYAFAESAEEFSLHEPDKLWALALRLASVSAQEAPVNSPSEFLPFCGVVAAGAIGSVHRKYFQEAAILLKKMANDVRWRTREGVAMGIQKLIAQQRELALKELDSWIAGSEWLIMRAVAGGVAEPALLEDETTAKAALAMHKKIFAHLLASKERKTDAFKTLRQALGYSLSVVVCSAPKEGFQYMRQLAASRDGDILWAVKENLKKNRLIKKFPNEVADLNCLVK